MDQSSRFETNSFEATEITSDSENTVDPSLRIIDDDCLRKVR